MPGSPRNALWGDIITYVDHGSNLQYSVYQANAPKSSFWMQDEGHEKVGWTRNTQPARREEKEVC